MSVLDLKRHHRWIGPRDKAGHLWATQDGKIFGWSESNCCFEEVWWLNPDGTPITGASNPAHVIALTQERPFDPKWLESGGRGTGKKWSSS